MNLNSNAQTHACRLYVMCGLPGSGKSTWATKNLPSDVVYFSRDQVRFSFIKDSDTYFARENDVFDAFVGGICLSLDRGESICADATHISAGSRKKLLRAVRETTTNPNFELIFVVMQTPYDECLRRNALREGRARVPDDVMLRMQRGFSAPQVGELGSTQVIYVK